MKIAAVAWFAIVLLPAIVQFADCCSSKVLQKKYHEQEQLQQQQQQQQHKQHVGNLQDKNNLVDEVRKQYVLIDNIRSLKCPDQLEKYYCLNEGRCFNYKIGRSNSYACECKDEFHGERCEYKYVLKHIRINNDTFTDYQLVREGVSTAGGGGGRAAGRGIGGGVIKRADLSFAPLLVAITAIIFIIFLIKKKIIQNCKNHKTVSAGRRRTTQFHLNLLDNEATHQCRYNCS